MAIYFIILIFEIINDSKIYENYEIINYNWEQNSISSISISASSDSNTKVFNWKNVNIKYKMNEFNYYDIHTNNNDDAKICGKDSQDNDLYFPKDVECPVNDIFISKFDSDEYENYTKIKLSDEAGYLYYTNKKTTGKIVVSIIANETEPKIYSGKEINIPDDEELDIHVREYYEKKLVKANNFNTIFFYEEIDSWNKNKLYAINYLGVNNNLIGKVNGFKKNKDKYKVLLALKYISNILNFFIYFYFIYILLNDVELYKLAVGIGFLLFMIMYIVSFTLCLANNLEYIEHFMNKINIDFERDKCDTIWTFLLGILGFIFTFFYLSIIVYKYLIVSDNILLCCSSCSCSCSCPKKSKEPSNSAKAIKVIPFKQEKEIKCVVCLTNEPKVILYPCRHKCVCQNCYTSINSLQPHKCPICRAIFTDGINIDNVFDP